MHNPVRVDPTPCRPHSCLPPLPSSALLLPSRAEERRGRGAAALPPPLPPLPSTAQKTARPFLPPHLSPSPHLHPLLRCRRDRSGAAERRSLGQLTPPTHHPHPTPNPSPTPTAPPDRSSSPCCRLTSLLLLAPSSVLSFALIAAGPRERGPWEPRSHPTPLTPTPTPHRTPRPLLLPFSPPHLSPFPPLHPLCFLRPDRRQHAGRKGEERRRLFQSGAAAEQTAMRERGATWGETRDTGAAVR